MTNIVFLISLVTFFVDRISKVYFNTNLILGNSMFLIKNKLHLTLAHNYGVAFSMLNNNRLIIIGISMIFLCLIVKYMNDFRKNKRNTLAFGLLIGGLFGNLYDRMIYGYVIDFIDIYIFGYDYPIFNIADVAIVIGIILLLIAILRKEDLYGSRNK